MASNVLNTNKSSTTTIDVGSVGISTPFSKGDKREASSPLDAVDTDSKKSRHHTGSSIIFNTEGDDTGSPSDASPVHMVSQPLHQLDIVNIATELRALMLPEMANIIKSQLPDIKAIVKESTNKLSMEIQALRDENAKLHVENAQLRKDVDALTTRVTKAEDEVDALEQYTRRNSVRISGFPESDGENTDEIVSKIADALHTQIRPPDIDRSHRIGKPKTGSRQRDIIVKFATYNARQRFYIRRMDLRNSGDEDIKRTFINEDLTKQRSQLLFDARSLVRVGKLKSAYSSDGKIFIRDNHENRYMIKSRSDILQHGDPDDAKTQLSGVAKSRGSAAS